MRMKSRVFSAVAATATALAIGMAVSAPANAAALELPIPYDADTSTVIKKLNQKVTFPQTPMTALLSSDDLSTGTLSAELKLPQTSTDLMLGPLNLATITMSIVEPSPVSGTVRFAPDFTSVALDAKQSFKIRIDSIQPLGISTGSANLNLLLPNANCVTSVTTANLNGEIDLTGTSLDTTLDGTYAIPAFTGCGNIVGPVLNTLVSGPGNTLSVDLKMDMDAAATAQLKSALNG